MAQRIASVMGLRVPAANGATVNGTKAADISLQLSRQPGWDEGRWSSCLSKAQW